MTCISLEFYLPLSSLFCLDMQLILIVSLYTYFQHDACIDIISRAVVSYGRQGSCGLFLLLPINLRYPAVITRCL